MKIRAYGSIPWFQRFILNLPFAIKIIKINLWNQGNGSKALQ
jgi:hypothetical protein